MCLFLAEIFIKLYFIIGDNYGSEFCAIYKHENQFSTIANKTKNQEITIEL